MAVTKIKPIKSTLSKALDYIENPDKTDGKMLVSSFGCSYETADIEFEYTLSQALQKYRSHRILSPYHSINHQIQKSEAFQSVHHVTFILCYTVLYDFLALVFSLIRVCKHWRDDITQGKQ